jgi:hypothetical protein
MSWLARIEEACAAFIERGFAKSFPSDLEPAQIARKLVAVMEARTERVDDRVLAPSHYVVYVHPTDFERLQPHRDYLQSEWAALLIDVAARVGMTFVSGEPHVKMTEGIDVVSGAVDIETDSGVRAPRETPEPPRRYMLRMVKGVPAVATYALAASTSVGRSKERDIALADPSVSRDHAVLEVDRDGAIVRDRASTNGTFVNGTRVNVQRLQSGDEVAFGTVKMRFEEASEE